MLENRDYTLIIDRSRSMSSSNQPEGQNRWASIQESTLALVRQCEELDSDGLTVYLFSHRFQRYRNVNSSQVERLFQDEDNTPQGGTNLSSVLQDVLNLYFERKACGQSSQMERQL